MIFTRRTFSKRQIKKVEKVKEKLLRDINMYEDIFPFVEEYHCITVKEYNTQWIKDLKDAINNIDLEIEEIAGKKVENGKYVKLLHDYFIGISNAIDKEIYILDGPIKKLIKEYQKQIILILV